MKKLLNVRLFTLSILGLGVFAMFSLTACDGAGDASSEQEKEKTEEAAPSEEAHMEDHSSAGSEDTMDAEADSTSHGDEHPAGGEEHPAGGDEHPN